MNCPFDKYYVLISVQTQPTLLYPVQVSLKNALVQTTGWESSVLRSLAEQHSSVSSGIGTDSSAHSICILWNNLRWFVVVWLFFFFFTVSQRDFLLTVDKWQKLKRGMYPLRISVKQWCEVKGGDCLAWTGRISRQAFVFVFLVVTLTCSLEWEFFAWCCSEQ